MTILYWMKFDSKLSNEQFHEKISGLPVNLQERISKFFRWQDSHACLYGKLLLLQALNDFKLSLSLEDIKYTEYRKPYFGEKDLDFNISHSGSCVVCLVSNQMKVGIDIEKVKQLSLGDFCNQFHEEEWEEVYHAENPMEAFYEFWTKKEALIKADGMGLNLPLQEINLSGAPESFIIKEEKWYLREVDLMPSYKCAIATSENMADALCIRYINFYN